MADTKNYITPEGLQKLRLEVDQLWRVERPKVTQEVADAAALGDRSENAEYIYGKRRLREIDHRLEFLSKRLKAVQVIPFSNAPSKQVEFGCWVSLEDEDENKLCYRIVGHDEFDVKEGLISVESPMAQALLGKAEGDDVEVHRPRGRAIFTILQISKKKPFSIE